MDTLTFLMQILGIIIFCAKVVAAVIAVLAGFAFLKYLSMRFRGLLPSVAATAFVISIVGANLEEIVNLFVMMWVRLASLISAFSNSVTLFLVLFTILLCCAIAVGFVISIHKSVGSIFKSNRVARDKGTGSHNFSNSFLAITPVLLS